MVGDSVSAALVVNASAEAVFAVLVDPGKHAAIDGTGWVQKSTDGQPLTAVGQIFRMRMFHAGHPNGDYETVNCVQQFAPPSCISWKTGYQADDGTLHFGEWFWQYDLAPAEPSGTTVTLTYDWSATSADARARIGFPPFPPEHLANSLAHLADLVTEEQ